MRYILKTAVSLICIAALLLMIGGCAAKKHKYKKGTPATMRTYCVMGKTYKPTYVSIGQRMNGVSSWYGPDFHGKSTSNGERYDMYARTAAHKTWPMDTMVKVTNLQNSKSTTVRINDRGPFVSGRIIDCSYTAGKEIGLDRMGIASVQIEVLGFSGQIVEASVAKAMPVSQRQIKLTNFGVQVGAFRLAEGARIYQRKYAGLYPNRKTIIRQIHDEEGYPLNRVWIMGFGSEEEARDFKICQDLPGAFIVRE